MQTILQEAGCVQTNYLLILTCTVLVMHINEQDKIQRTNFNCPWTLSNSSGLIVEVVKWS